uniref:Uncharacterized protein n=1 Tax=Candidatus Kentrum sp. DK TaxID=2126562 RepID=A0A450S786_9GAMM|nr:MAG: hypothetical protein BECKDK2373C_GA0170839_101914 [Candidatus Kentron sp. DK]
MEQYRSLRPNHVHQLTVSVSKHYWVTNDGILKYQHKKMEVSLDAVSTSKKNHLIFFIIRDHFSGVVYFEVSTAREGISLDGALYRAWSRKEYFDFCGIPELLTIPKTVEKAFPGIKEKISLLGVKFPKVTSGFQSGVREVRTLEEYMGIYAEKPFEANHESINKTCVYLSSMDATIGKQPKIELWRNHVGAITVPPASWPKTDPVLAAPTAGTNRGGEGSSRGAGRSSATTETDKDLKKKRFREQANRARRELTKERERYGFINDGAGRRYRVPVYYLLAGANEKALDFYAWYESTFPNDTEEPISSLYWALAELRAGREEEALYRLQITMISNLYLLPFLFHEPIEPLDIWHASNYEHQDYLWEVEEYLDEPTDGERQWIKDAYHSQPFEILRNEYVRTYHDLNGEHDVRRRSDILDKWRQFYLRFFDKRWLKKNKPVRGSR